MEKSEQTKPLSFESVVSQVPRELQSEILAMDGYLKALRPLRFKRNVGKSGRIKYVAPDFGISYGINLSDTESLQHFGWYFVYDNAEQRWHRKSDCMEEVLAEISKTAPQLASRIFDALKTCTLCKSPSCGQIAYTYLNEEKVACYGRVHLGLCSDDFNDARAFFRQLNALIAHKTSGEGETP